MSKLTTRKTKLMIETADTVRECGAYREVILEADSRTPTLLTVRAKGLRTRYTVEASTVYHLAVKLYFEQKRREKKAGRK